MTNDFPLIQADLREHNGQLRLVKGLTEQWLSTVRLLLEGQSSRDLNAFDAAVGRLMDDGYQLTSLVVELHCASGGSYPKAWSFEVRPKIGAKPGSIKRTQILKRM